MAGQPELASDRVRKNLSQFINELRASGYAVNASNIQLANEILCTPIIENQRTLKTALRSVFTQTKQQWDAFDVLFDHHWLYHPTDTDERSDTGQGGSLNQQGLTSGLGYFSETQAQRAASSLSLIHI